MPTLPSRACVRAMRRSVPTAVLIALAAFVVAFACPRAALADTYSLPRVHTQAQVMENGDLFVTEARTFSFEDDVNGVYWEIPFARSEQGQASSITVLDVQELDDAVVDGSEAEARRATQPMREVAWAESGDAHVYTVEDTGEGLKLKVFVPREDGDEVTLWVSYMIEGAVMAWPDTAELYWQFIGSGWEEDAEDVRLDVTFAGAAQGTPAITGTADAANLRAWGHGPLDGEVSLDVADPTDPHVTLTAPTVRAGQFAEVRAVFPADWVPGLAPSGESRLDGVIAEETAWANEANARRERTRRTAVIGTAIFVVGPALMLALVIYLRKTKYANYKSTFDETYFRDIPSKDHPAVLSALMHGGSVQDCAFIATLMKLTDDRVIKVSHRTRTEDGFLGMGKKKVEEYSIQLIARELTTDPIDQAALDLYFGPDSKNGTARYLSTFQSLDDVGERLQAFKDQVVAGLELRRLTNLVPIEFKVGVIFVCIMLGCGGLIFTMKTDGVSFPFIAAGVAMAIAAAVFAGTAKQYTPGAVELLCRCQALERWLVDFTNLDEAVPDDLILWNKMLVLAAAFGVSDEVLRQLADAVPVDLRESEDGTYYYPSYVWYHRFGGMGSPMSEMHDSYQALVSSSSSSGSGGGGGFSGGGGGGVGGGGGGTF